MNSLLNRAYENRSSRWQKTTQEIPYLILLVFLTVSMCLPLLTKYPAPGGDEPGFVDPAVTLLTKGYIGTEVYHGLLPTMEHHVYWVPPLYFVLLAGWFRLFGIGLVQARSFSVLCASIIVLWVYLLSRRRAQKTQALAAATLCAVSFWLIDRACFARMDTLCVALTLASIFMYQNANDRSKLELYALSGLLAGLALLTHPLGIIAIIILLLHLLLTHKKEILLRREFYFVVICFICCVAVWTCYILQDYAAFHVQMQAQLERKQSAWSYWYQFKMAKTHVITLLVVIMAGLWLILRGWRTSQSGLIAISVVVAFGAATYGHEAGYFLYFYPFACVALSIALSQVHRFRALVYVGLLFAFMNESIIFVHDFRRYHTRDYTSLSQTIRAAIPPGESVFIGFSDVSPYFALLGRNPMRVAIPVPLPDPYASGKIAQQCNFIVDSLPDPYLPDVNKLLESRRPLVQIDQGTGYRISVFGQQSNIKNK